MSNEPVITKRLEELKQEFRQGQNILKDLKDREQEILGTLTRISGAIQVLEELQSSASVEVAAS